MQANQKRFLGLFCLLLIGSLTACQPSTKQTANTAEITSTEDKETTDTSAPTESALPETTDTYQVAICQISSDPYGDSLTQGFQDGFRAKGTELPVSFLIKKVQGDTDTLTEQCKELDQSGLDLIFIENTEASLLPDVSDYQTAVLTLPEINAVKPAEQTLLQLLPDIQQVGIVYDAADPVSTAKAKQMMQYLEADHISYQEYPATDAVSFDTQANHICDQCDAAYLPADTLALSQAATLEDLFLPAGIPLVSDHLALSDSSIAIVSLQSYELGYQYGEAAAELLQNQTAADVPTDAVSYLQTYYNPQVCDDFAIDVPKDMNALPDND